MFKTVLSTFLVLACASLAQGQMAALVSYNVSNCTGPPKQIVYYYDPTCATSGVCEPAERWGGDIPMKKMCGVDGYKLTPQLYGKHPVVSAIKFNSTKCLSASYEWTSVHLADGECILEFNGSASVRVTIQPEKKQVTYLKYFTSKNCSGTPYTEVTPYDTKSTCLPGGWVILASSGGALPQLSVIILGVLLLLGMLL